MNKLDIILACEDLGVHVDGTNEGPKRIANDLKLEDTKLVEKKDILYGHSFGKDDYVEIPCGIGTLFSGTVAVTVHVCELICRFVEAVRMRSSEHHEGFRIVRFIRAPSVIRYVSERVGIPCIVSQFIKLP